MFIAADMPPQAAQIVHIEFPEQGFFTKKLMIKGIPIKAPECVDDKAMVEAGKRIWSQIGKQPGIILNMANAGAELHIIGKNQVTSDLPYLRHYRGQPYDGKLTIDERTRGVGGRQASCGEENLLKLKKDRYRGRDICRHEFAHTILNHGMDPLSVKMVKDQYAKSIAEGKWKNCYAASNYNEYWAELTMWYFGTHGDYRDITPTPRDGPEWLKSYDPGGYEMVDSVYSGRWKVGLMKERPQRRQRKAVPAASGTSP